MVIPNYCMTLVDMFAEFVSVYEFLDTNVALEFFKFYMRVLFVRFQVGPYRIGFVAIHEGTYKGLVLIMNS